jgi:hypothetical protein
MSRGAGAALSRNPLIHWHCAITVPTTRGSIARRDASLIDVRLMLPCQQQTCIDDRDVAAEEAPRSNQRLKWLLYRPTNLDGSTGPAVRAALVSGGTAVQLKTHLCDIALAGLDD